MRPPGEGPGSCNPCDVVNDWVLMGKEAEVQGHLSRSASDTPIARATIIATSANVTSAFCSHRMKMNAVDRAYAAEDDHHAEPVAVDVLATAGRHVRDWPGIPWPWPALIRSSARRWPRTPGVGT